MLIFNAITGCLVLYGWQAVVLCQVEKAKEDMLNQLYSSVRFRNLFTHFHIFFVLCTLDFFPCILSVVPEFFGGMWICLFKVSENV